jgi:hypothetical protein
MYYPGSGRPLSANVMPISNSDMNIPDTHLRALKIIIRDLADISNPWCITGSVGLLIQKVDVSVHDIDLQSTKQGVYEIQERLDRYVIEPVALKESAALRSYFGRCQIEEVLVELMGDIRKRSSDGLWSEAPDLNALVHSTSYADLLLPVLDLEYEAQAYKALGRLDKFRKIKEAIDANI